MTLGHYYCDVRRPHVRGWLCSLGAYFATLMTATGKVRLCRYNLKPMMGTR